MINAKNKTLKDMPPGLPNVQGAMRGWFQKITGTQFVKTIENYQSVVVPTVVEFMGVLQPFSPQQLQMLPEGQRSWKWWTIHATPDFQLTTDEIIEIKGVKYRVQAKTNYAEYGYVEYSALEDYTP